MNNNDVSPIGNIGLPLSSSVSAVTIQDGSQRSTGPESSTTPDSASPNKPDKPDTLFWLKGKVEAWNDGNGEAYVTLIKDGARAHYSVDSDHLRTFLCGTYYKETNRVLHDPGESVETLRFEGLSGPTHPVALRVAVGDELAGKAIYVDNVGPRGICLRVPGRNGTGWSEEEDPPFRFIRPAGQRPLPVPQSGGSIKDLSTLVTTSEDGFHQIIGFVLGCYRPDLQCPILFLSGPQGSGKSQLTAMVRELVDPREPVLSSLPSRPLDLAVMCKNMHLAAFDNGSHITAAMSDALCKAVGGDAIEGRRLYTNGELSVVKVPRSRVLLNGIPHLAERGDLADRALTVKLSALDEEKRLEELELRQRSQEMMPRLLGAILRGAAAGLKEPKTPARKPRLLDWACFVTGAEAALGLAPNTITGASWKGREDALEAVLEASLTASALLSFRDACVGLGKGEWQGTLRELLTELEKHAQTRDPYRWPRNEKGLSDELRRLQPMLKEVGVTVEFLGKKRIGEGGRKIIRIRFSAV